MLRPNEAEKLSQQLGGRCKQRGLVVPFCPQLEVLAHKATGTYEMIQTQLVMYSYIVNQDDDKKFVLEEKNVNIFLPKCM